jgi:hypothetical protein
MYSDRVRYAAQLQRYHEVFPSEQVLVLIYDDFRADNEGTLRRVLEFLGVNAAAPMATLEANPSVEVRAVRSDQLIRRVREGHSAPARAARSAVRALTTPRLRENVLFPLRRRVVYGESRPPDAAVVAELRGRFAPEVAAASEYLGRDLAGLWGYPTSGATARSKARRA